MIRHNNFDYQIELTGLNFEKFYDQLLITNIKVTNIKKIEVNKIKLNVDYKNYKKLLLIAKNMCYNVNVLSTGPYLGLKSFVINNLGILFGLVVSLALFIVFSQYTLHINVIGLNTLSQNEIVEVLSGFNIKTGKINDQSNEEIEDILSQNIDKISLVSVTRIGTSLIINIKEKLPDIDDEFQPIIAQENMLISEITVYAGYSNFHVGDLVKRGQTLVEPFNVNSDGDKISIKPVADIKADIWYTNSTTFYNTEVKRVRSGSKSTDRYLILFDKVLIKISKTPNFKEYEVEESEKIINNVIPIKERKVTYFELIEATITRDWEREKDQEINELIQKTYSELPENTLIIDEKIVITKCDDKIIINVYLSSVYELKGSKNAS